MTDGPDGPWHRGEPPMRWWLAAAAARRASPRRVSFDERPPSVRLFERDACEDDAAAPPPPPPPTTVLSRDEKPAAARIKKSGFSLFKDERLARAMSEQGLSVVDASKALVKAWAKLAPDEKQRFNARAAELNASNGV